MCVRYLILLTGSWLICRCTGFIFQKVGKLAATAVGGGFFLLQVCMNSGPGFPRTVLVGTKGCLVIGTCRGVWGQIPALLGALCGRGCHRCVFPGVRRYSSKAGSACVNLRIATRHRLLGVCNKGQAQGTWGCFRVKREAAFGCSKPLLLQDCLVRTACCT